MLWKITRICEASQERYFFVKEHSERTESQYSCFKKANIEATSSDGETVTIHIGWSEKVCIRQAPEEESAYYFEDQIWLHAMWLYEHDGKISLVLMSDDTSHGAVAVIASIRRTSTKHL